MTDEEKIAYRQELIKQFIGVAAYALTLLAFQFTIDPVFRQVWIARARQVLGLNPPPGEPEPPREWVRSIYDDLRDGAGDGG
jgi:hypothetical protein